MNKCAVYSIALGLLFFGISASRSHAVISVNIYQDIYQQPVFEVSGQFDSPINTDLEALVSFAFAPNTVSILNTPYIYPFASSLATIVNLTHGSSADISSLYIEPYNLTPYAYFNLSAPLPIFAGDTLELISHGPESVSGIPFGNFVAGDYVFNHPSLGTFEVHVVPEPASLALLGLSFAALAMLRKPKPVRGQTTTKL